MAQAAVVGTFGELDLDHHLGPHPVRDAAPGMREARRPPRTMGCRAATVGWPWPARPIARCRPCRRTRARPTSRSRGSASSGHRGDRRGPPNRSPRSRRYGRTAAWPSRCCGCPRGRRGVDTLGHDPLESVLPGGRLGRRPIVEGRADRPVRALAEPAFQGGSALAVGPGGQVDAVATQQVERHGTSRGWLRPAAGIRRLTGRSSGTGAIRRMAGRPGMRRSHRRQGRRRRRRRGRRARSRSLVTSRPVRLVIRNPMSLTSNGPHPVPFELERPAVAGRQFGHSSGEHGMHDSILGIDTRATLQRHLRSARFSSSDTENDEVST